MYRLKYDALERAYMGLDHTLEYQGNICREMESKNKKQKAKIKYLEQQIFILRRNQERTIQNIKDFIH